MAESCVGSGLIRAFVEERRKCLYKLVAYLTRHGHRIYLVFVVPDIYHSVRQYRSYCLANRVVFNTIFDPSLAALICLCRIRTYRRKIPNRKRITSGRCSYNVSVSISHGILQLLIEENHKLSTACVSQLATKQYNIPPFSLPRYISKNLIVLTTSTLKLDSERSIRICS